MGTVSRVLNNGPDVSDAAREKIMAVVEEHHFRLNNNAKHLKQQSSSGIAIVVKGTQNVLFATIVERIQSLVRDSGYVSFIYYLDEDDDELEQASRSAGNGGPSASCSWAAIWTISGVLPPSRSPVCWSPTPPRSCNLKTSPASAPTTSEAAARALGYLMELGHTQIGVLGGKMEVSQRRLRAICGRGAGLREHQMPFDRETQYESARFAMSDGYAAMGRLLDKMPGLTAVFAMSDVQAVGAIRALHDRGLRVPEDISVVGFDGIELGRYVSPSSPPSARTPAGWLIGAWSFCSARLGRGHRRPRAGALRAGGGRERPGPRPAVAGARSSSMRPGALPVYTLSGQGHCPVDCLT